MQNNDFYNDIGLFRFSLLAPAINKTHSFNSNNAYFKDVSSRKYFFDGKEYSFSVSCLKKWYYKYINTGFSSLGHKTRNDFKKSRRLSNDVILRIISLREEFPHITGSAIYDKLINENYINNSTVSLSTVLRYLKSNNLKANQVFGIERKMFEMENVNDCWQSDTSDGPYIIIDKQKYRTKLIMFIDDKSRMIVGYDFFLNDNAINMQKVFMTAIKTYGKPKKLFVDNGGTYANKQLSLICASLGVQLIHAKPYSPESKAKIERSFRTIKDGWLRCTDWNSFITLDDVKKSLSDFIYNNYINTIHSSTNQTPNERWHNEYKNVVFLDEKYIDEAFLHRIKRKVRNDRTVKINNSFFEVPFKYVRQTIEIRYDPNDLNVVFIFEDNTLIDTCYPVDKVANSKVKRKNSIDYSKAINDERDVLEVDCNVY